jgi:hypothetical protein
MSARQKIFCALLAASAAFAAAGDGNKPAARNAGTNEVTRMLNADGVDKAEDGSKFSRGAVCLTFDDAHFEKWVGALPLFKKYGAHATFFVTGDVNGKVIESVKKLLAEGHTVGTHGLRHRDAPPTIKQVGAEKYVKDEIQPQLAAFTRAGIAVTCHAYANNRRDEKSDDALRRLAGLCRFRPVVFPKTRVNRLQRGIPRFSRRRRRFHPVMRGLGIGEYYNTEVEEVLAAVRRLRIATRSSQSSPCDSARAKGIHMPTETLEAILKECSKLE